MKRIKISIMAAVVATIGCQAPPQEVVISGGFRFNESTTPYDGGLLIPSFGASELNPLNNEGRGYISLYKDGATSTLIEADGTLNAPKGMAVCGDKLIVCDVAKVLLYNLSNPSAKPTIISLPDGELFVNDVVVVGENAYISVTNTGNIYKLSLNNLSLEIAINVPGANGLLVEDGVMYVASYPASGVTSDENVLYIIDDINHPVARKLIDTPAQYDGLAKIKGSDYIYVSNWTPAEVLKVNIRSGESETLPIEEEMVGPADISILDGYLYIPDLVNSKVIGYKIDE